MTPCAETTADSASPCNSLSCHEAPVATCGLTDAPQRSWPWWVHCIADGLYQAQHLCLEKLKAPPTRIVVLGGCQQLALAEFLAFRYPDSKIALLDPDASRVTQAQASIQCRFHFLHAPVEAIPLPNDSVDLVIGHQMLDYVADWPTAANELARVCKGQLLLSVAMPYRSRFARLLPQTTDWMAANGLSQLTTLPWNEVLRPLMPHGRIIKYIEPLPWRMIQVAIKPLKEQRLKWD
jgi:SAM-dependent methyltransferase